MAIVFLIAGALWGIGLFLGVPRKSRMSALGTLYIAVMAVQILLPKGHMLREATGETPALWFILGLAALLVAVYRRGLRWLHDRAEDQRAAAPVPVQETFSETELDRYARHIVLRELGGTGQRKIKQARVLVIGAGGLGSPALQYLSAAGVGTIGVIDDDRIENANLQRQVIHLDKNIGMAKVFSAEAAMIAQNPYVTVRPYNRRLTEEIAEELFADYDVVLDGSDNFDTRYMVNRVAVKLQKPLVSGALSQWEGQLSVFDPAVGTPCYQCIFAVAPAEGLAPSCGMAGVLGPLPGVVGAMMAVETIKLIALAGTPLHSEMLIYDALYGESRKFALKRRADCPVCGHGTPKPEPHNSSAQIVSSGSA